MEPPWSTWDPYLGIPSLAPWASPYLQMLWDPPKNLKTRGCESVAQIALVL